jgi:hypothetical protein
MAGHIQYGIRCRWEIGRFPDLFDNIISYEKSTIRNFLTLFVHGD